MDNRYEREFDKRSREEPLIYQIRVGRIIGPQWSSWFGDLEIVPLADGETLLVGPVVDQAALHGILAKVRNLNLPLISVNSAPAE